MNGASAADQRRPGPEVTNWEVAREVLRMFASIAACTGGLVVIVAAVLAVGYPPGYALFWALGSSDPARDAAFTAAPIGIGAALGIGVVCSAWLFARDEIIRERRRR